MTDRLYGIPGAEELDADLAGAYERHEGDWIIEQGPDDSNAIKWQPSSIEEWSASTVKQIIEAQALDHAIRIVERLSEDIADDIGLESVWGTTTVAAADNDVIEAFVAAVNLFASKCTGYSVANRRLHTYAITWDADGEPLADGQPIYRPRGDGQ